MFPFLHLLGKIVDIRADAATSQEDAEHYPGMLTSLSVMEYERFEYTIVGIDRRNAND